MQMSVSNETEDVRVWSGQGLMEEFSEQDNDPSSFIKDGAFFTSIVATCF